MAAVWLVVPGLARAQTSGDADRGLRFLLASAVEPTRLLPVDVSRTPILKNRLTLDLAHVTLKEALSTIATKAGLELVYTADVVPLRSRVDIRADGITVAAALTDVMVDADVDVVFTSPRRAVLKRRVGAVMIPAGSLAGTVTDAKTNQGLAAVDVLLEGTRWRATTAADGRYHLTDVTPGTYTLVARRIGYARQSRPVTVTDRDQATVDFVLVPSATKLADVVVTAEKREERLQDVPAPVTAISAAPLVENNQLRLLDYFASVPGLNVEAGPNGDTHLAIRGVSAGSFFGNPTVGVTVDDVPYGSSSSYGGLGMPALDLDPGDLSRVEVLRGPQGTLYGVSSIGGLLKYVTLDPSTAGVTGRLQAGTGTTNSAGEIGYNFRGSVNIPLSRTWALRASGFDRRDPGYVDDPFRRLQDVNRIDAYGGRLSALWQPSPATSLKLSGVLQSIKAGGSSFVDVAPGWTGLQHSDWTGAGKFKDRSAIFSAILKTRVGAGELTSVSGYNVNTLNNSWMFNLGDLPTQQFGAAANGSLLVNYAQTKKFSQEVRLSHPIGRRVDWLVGAFYTHERSDVIQDGPATDTLTGRVVTTGTFLHATWPTTFSEYALFTDFNLHFTDRFSLQLGARESENRQNYSEIDAGLWGPLFLGLSDPVINPEQKTKDNSFTYLVAPQLKLSPDFMVYLRFASGYRAGGPNPTATVFNIPQSFKPDKTKNYEFGTKGSILRNALAFDLSLYYVDWKGIQIAAFEPGIPASFFDNAGSAKSEGVELSLESRPWTGLTTAGWVAFNHAVLTQPFPATSPIFAQAGDRLPNSSRWSGNVSADQDFRVSAGTTASIGGAVSYVGDRAGGYKADAQSRQPDLPAYAKVDLRARLAFSAWTINAFVNNLTNKRGVMSGDLQFSTRFVYIQPRTVGFAFAKPF
jgi:outer membrane receptor protein involved in Fe transport